MRKLIIEVAQIVNLAHTLGEDEIYSDTGRFLVKPGVLVGL